MLPPAAAAAAAAAGTARRAAAAAAAAAGAARRAAAAATGGRRAAATCAFAFDIDGVLALDERPIAGAPEAVQHLQASGVPFCFITNGGGRTEASRAEQLRSLLGVDVDASRVIQSHTPMRHLEHLKRANVFAVGRGPVAEILRSYGFESVVTPEALGRAFPDANPFHGHEPLPPHERAAFVRDKLPIDAALVLTEPTDFGRDMQLLVDVLAGGGMPDAPNAGAGHQPEVVFSNGDLLWANSFAQPRLGQGAFRDALRAMLEARTGGEGFARPTELGKPTAAPFEMAEATLDAQAESNGDRVEAIVMVGDNPAADIDGANARKAADARWRSLLVRTGVYRETHTEAKGAAWSFGAHSSGADAVADNVLQGVELMLQTLRFRG